MFILSDFFRLITRYRLKLILLFAAAVWGAIWVWPAQKLTLVFCSVGQGDAAIVIQGFTQILIDAGPAVTKDPVTDCLDRHLPFFDHHLEAAIISHPQVDHFGGLAAVLNRYQVDKFVFNGYAGDSRAWADLSGLIAAEKSQIVTLAAGGKLKIGEIQIDVLWPAKGSDLSPRPRSDPFASVLGASASRDLNADALVLKLTYGEFSSLFTGDIGETEEKKIIKNNLTIQQFNNFDILKVAHHGSKTSSSSEFLEAIRPALAVIEVGKNSYGHPADESIKRLEAVGAKILRTDRDGDIVVETDGKTWNISNIKNQISNIQIKN